MEELVRQGYIQLHPRQDICYLKDIIQPATWDYIQQRPALQQILLEASRYVSQLALTIPLPLQWDEDTFDIPCLSSEKSKCRQKQQHVIVNIYHHTATSVYGLSSLCHLCVVAPTTRATLGKCEDHSKVIRGKSLISLGMKQAWVMALKVTMA